MGDPNTGEIYQSDTGPRSPGDVPLTGEQANALSQMDIEKRKAQLRQMAAYAEQREFTPKRFGLDHAAIDDIFTYHSPTPEQVPKYEAVRAKARELGHTILECTPGGPDQTAAIRLLREAVMTANACIALDGKY